jgi:hypothetical protein
MSIANLPAIVTAAPEPAIPEPISPELVLVDPELRQALLAQESLARVPLQVVPDAQPPPTPPESTPEREPVPLPKILWLSDRQAPAPVASPPQALEVPSSRRRKLVRVALPISLALNAALIALTVSDATVSPQESSPAPVLDATAPANNPQESSPSKSGQGSSSGSTAGAPSGVARPRNGALERKVLNLIVQAPAGKLPRALIDPKTGLAKNGLQAVCRRESAQRSFLCVIQPPKHKLGEGLYVRYGVNRKGTGGAFTWYRYRNG